MMVQSHVTRACRQLDDKRVFATLAAILVAAAALRFYGLNAGLWFDEIFTYVKYARLSFWEIVSTYDYENQHLLNSLLAHASFELFGESAWSLRLPAVLFGLGSIWALYCLGRQVSSVREALLSAALLTFSYHHIWFSQNARGYTGLLCWTLLSSVLLIRALYESQSRLWLFYACAVALGVYAHLMMLAVVSSHFIIYLTTLVRRTEEVWPGKWTGLVGFCLAGVLVILMYALVLPQMWSYFTEKHFVSVGIWKNPLWTLLEFIKGIEVSVTSRLVAVVAALSVFGVGLVSFVRTKPMIVELLLIPSLICAIVVIGVGHHIWPRLFFFAFGFGILIVIRGTMLLGHAIARLCLLSPDKAPLLGTTLCIGLVLCCALSIPSVYGPKQDYEGALQFVEANREPGDAVVAVGLSKFPYTRFYDTDWQTAETLSALHAAHAQAKRTWVVYTFPVYLQSLYPHGVQLMNVVQRDFQLIKTFPGTLRGGTVFVRRSN